MMQKKKKIIPAALKRGRKLIAHDMPKGWELSLKQRNKRTHPIRALESNRRCSSSFLGREAGEEAEGRSLSPGRLRRVRAVSSHAQALQPRPRAASPTATPAATASSRLVGPPPDTGGEPLSQPRPQPPTAAPAAGHVLQETRLLRS